MMCQQGACIMHPRLGRILTNTIKTAVAFNHQETTATGTATTTSANKTTVTTTTTIQ